MAGAALFILAGTNHLFADQVAIGQLALSYDNGFQDVSFFNFTGLGQGCQVNGAQYSVCNGVTIQSWTMTIDFTNENPSDPTPSYDNTLGPSLTFTSSLSDTIGPYDGVNTYLGGSSGTWQIPLSFGNPDEPLCGPTCDYQITQVTFSGIISAVDTPFRLGNSGTYDAGNPSTYTAFNAQQTFSAIWNVSGADYSGLILPQFLYDTTDVFVSDQAAPPPPPPPPPPTLPEPASLGFFGSGALTLVALKYRHLLSASLGRRQ
jgi:hypothetical protein